MVFTPNASGGAYSTPQTSAKFREESLESGADRKREMRGQGGGGRGVSATQHPTLSRTG